MRPFIVLSKCVSRMIVQAASKVSLACGTWAETNRRTQRERHDNRERSRERARHLMSALIGAGRSNIDGDTLSNSTVVIFSTCSTPIAVCFIVVGTSMPPNFL